MTSADFIRSTPGANPLAVLPPRRRTGARVEPLISGVRAVKHNKKFVPRNIGAGGTVNSAKILHPKGSTSVRDRSMSRRLVSAASNSTYALCSGSLIRKIELGWVGRYDTKV